MGKDRHARDRDTGRFEQKISDNEILDAIGTAGATTAEVAERVGAPTRTAHHRLTLLAEQDAVEKRTVGPAVLWRHPEERE